jgi:hypothetical protein
MNRSAETMLRIATEYGFTAASQNKMPRDSSSNDPFAELFEQPDG